MPSKLRVQFGQNVCKQRDLCDLRQNELAHLLEIEPGYLCRIESGAARPSHELIVGIRAALECPWDLLHEGMPLTLADWKSLRTKRGVA